VFLNVDDPTLQQRPRSPEERGMRTIMSIAAAVVLSVAIVAPVSAAPGDAYKARKAECKARAKTMNFGVHLIKKNRWVNDCIAGRHSA
jgi:hypothetical protein